MLFWALAGGDGEQGVHAMIRSPLPNLLSAIALDARALATLTRSSRTEDVKVLAPSLDSLYRRIATAAEISLRKQELEQHEGDRAGGDPPPPPVLFGPK